MTSNDKLEIKPTCSTVSWSASNGFKVMIVIPAFIIGLLPSNDMEKDFNCFDAGVKLKFSTTYLYFLLSLLFWNMYVYVSMCSQIHRYSPIFHIRSYMIIYIIVRLCLTTTRIGCPWRSLTWRCRRKVAPGAWRDDWGVEFDETRDISEVRVQSRQRTSSTHCYIWRCLHKIPSGAQRDYGGVDIDETWNISVRSESETLYV